MSKFETEFSIDELYRLAYDWNGFIFDEVLKYCAKCRMFPQATNIGDVQTHIKERIKKRTGDDTEISRDTFNRWRKDGAKGPRNSETILLLDTLISEVHFCIELVIKRIRNYYTNYMYWHGVFSISCL